MPKIVSSEIKKRIVELHNQGLTLKAIEAELDDVSYGTIQRIVDYYKRTGNIKQNNMPFETDIPFKETKNAVDILTKSLTMLIQRKKVIEKQIDELTQEKKLIDEKISLLDLSKMD